MASSTERQLRIPRSVSFDLGFMEKFADVKVDRVESTASGRNSCRFRLKIGSILSAGQWWTIDVAERDWLPDFG